MKVFGPTQVKLLKVAGLLAVALALGTAYSPMVVAKFNHQPCGKWLINKAEWLPNDEMWACTSDPDTCQAVCVSLQQTVPQLCALLEKDGKDL